MNLSEDQDRFRRQIFQDQDFPRFFNLCLWATKLRLTESKQFWLKKQQWRVWSVATFSRYYLSRGVPLTNVTTFLCDILEHTHTHTHTRSYPWQCSFATQATQRGQTPLLGRRGSRIVDLCLCVVVHDGCVFICTHLVALVTHQWSVHKG